VEEEVYGEEAGLAELAELERGQRVRRPVLVNEGAGPGGSANAGRLQGINDGEDEGYQQIDFLALSLFLEWPLICRDSSSAPKLRFIFQHFPHQREVI